MVLKQSLLENNLNSPFQYCQAAVAQSESASVPVIAAQFNKQNLPNVDSTAPPAESTVLNVDAVETTTSDMRSGNYQEKESETANVLLSHGNTMIKYV